MTMIPFSSHSKVIVINHMLHVIYLSEIIIFRVPKPDRFRTGATSKSSFHASAHVLDLRSGFQAHRDGGMCDECAISVIGGVELAFRRRAAGFSPCVAEKINPVSCPERALHAIGSNRHELEKEMKIRMDS